MDGAEQPLALDGTLQVAFVDGGVSVNAGCNTLFGPADLSGGTIALTGELASTKMACAPELMAQDDELAAFFSAGPTWALEGSVLTLTGGTTTITLDAARPQPPGAPDGGHREHRAGQGAGGVGPQWAEQPGPADHEQGRREQ